MKTKKASKTNAKSRMIFFAISITYNLLLGLYLKDFLVLSPMLVTFYLLSALPTLFFVIRIRSTPMRTIVYVVLFFVLGMSFVSSFSCRRLLPMLTFLVTAMELMYLALFDNSSGKDKPLTKIYVLAVTAVTVVTLFCSYNFVCKPESPYLLNGGATLWDTDTVKLADEICADCDTDEEKVKSIYEWMIHNFEYDYECEPIIQYFNVRKTVKTQKGICYDFAHMFAALCRSQNIPCYVIDGTKIDDANYHHTWNSVYFNRSWWNADVTFDAIQIQVQGRNYGFHNIKSIFVSNGEYLITQIY